MCKIIARNRGVRIKGRNYHIFISQALFVQKLLRDFRSPSNIRPFNFRLTRNAVRVLGN